MKLVKLVVEKEIDVYEETENCGAGGEGDSSRAHSIPDGTWHHLVHGARTCGTLRIDHLSKRTGSFYTVGPLLVVEATLKW